MATPIEWKNETQTNTGAADVSGISDSQIIGLSNGNYLVAWTEAGTTGVATQPGNDVIGKIFDIEGNLVRDSFRLNTNLNADDEDDFDIAATNDGGFIIVYVDDDISNSSQEAIRWEKHNAAGNQTDFFTLSSNTVAGEVVSNPKVVVNNNDNSSFVTFTSVDSGETEVRAVRLDATGTVLTAEFDAAQNTTGNISRNAEAAINTNGELVTVYQEDDAGTFGIELFITNTAGAQQHNVQVTGASASDAQVATLANGNIAVSWVEGSQVKYRVYDSNAAAQTGILDVDGAADTTNEPHMAALPDGGFVITWDNDTDNTLEARRFNEDGTTSATDTIFTLEPSAGAEINPNVGVMADGRVLFSWEEGDNVFSSIWDTRGNNIDANDYDGLPLNFIESDITTANVINTTLIGDSDNDTLLGQGGDDSITGASGADSIEGGAGNDTIDGGLFTDTVNGGAGNDSIIISAGNAADVVNGGSGTDTLDFSASGLSGDVIFTSATGGTYIGGNTFSSIEEIKAGSASSTIDLFFGNQTVDAGAGDDVFIHGDGEFIDNLDGGAGTDTLDLSAELGDGVDIDLGAGTWSGLGGTRTIAAIESVIGTQADDVIDMGTGFNVNVDAQGGNDLVFANNGLPEVLNGGTGNDTLDTTSYVFDYDVNLTTGVTNFAGESFINFENIVTGDGDDDIVGTSGANEITTKNGNDLISGLFGADTVSAGNGNDTVFGGGDNDLLLGQGGNDFIRGDTGNDTIRGGAGSDTLNGSNGNDRLFGEGSSDNINGDAGNDFISGGSGNDSITGGDGTDFIQGQGNNDVISGGNNNDTILGQAGLDNIGGDDGNDVILGGGAADTVDGGAGDDTVDGGTERDLVTGGSGNDSLLGGGGDDTIDGESGQDTIDGGTGDDIVDGGTGNDMLEGGGGSDTLDGGAGGDTVDGGTGADLLLVAAGEGGDILFGGTGADVFDFESGFVVVKVEDFGSTDLIDLQDVATVSSFGDLTINYGGGGTNALVDLGGGDEIIFNNLTALLNAGDFVF